MSKSSAGKRRAAVPTPLPMAAPEANVMWCEGKYGITVRSKSRRCRRCPKVWQQR